MDQLSFSYVDKFEHHELRLVELLGM